MNNQQSYNTNAVAQPEDSEPPSGQAQIVVSPQVKVSLVPPREKIIHKFVIGKQANKFRNTFFPSVSANSWNDWSWQLQNSITNVTALSSIIKLTSAELQAISQFHNHLPIRITPYYASLMAGTRTNHPIRRSVVPVVNEFVWSKYESSDPLTEEHDSPVPGIVHRYPDRVLFLTTSFCSTYCRYCTRSRMVGDGVKSFANRSNWHEAIRYISQHKEIRDVLLSGGDPLTLPDGELDWLLTKLRQIKHVEIIRIGTKVPVVLPQRITPALIKILKKFHPLWMSIHFTHPEELTEETVEACTRLADAGIPLGSQTVLLAGINDSVDVMRKLVQKLMRARVRPYYLYQCDPISGSAHFRTPVEKGLEIIAGLRGHTTGYAIPHFVIDAPGGGGKIPLLPEYVVGREGDNLILRNFEGNNYAYPDPHRQPITEKIAHG